MKLASGFYIDSPSWPLYRAMVSYEGITTAAGNFLGTTLVDALCSTAGTQPSYTGLLIKIKDGNAAGQVRQISVHDLATGTITVATPFSNPTGAAQQILASIGFVILSTDGAALAALRVQEVVIYPVAEDAGLTELADDGASPVYYPVPAHSTNAHAEATPGVAWSEDIDFEQLGTITIISIYAEFEWQTRFLVGAGAGTQSSSKIQISRDAGANWVDLTDNFNNAAAVMANRIRAGVGRWIPTVGAGANQLMFRLVHWSDDAGGISTSEAQVRSNSYVRITYRKS